MSGFYQTFLEKHIDLTPLGVGQASEHTPYFCTPKGASIIGWAGVDGIHFCFVRGFGEMVFAVSPMNAPGSSVHPLARNFEDFLRLLLACSHSAALEQAWSWDQDEFDEFLRESIPMDEQAATLHIICETLSLTPMEHPFDSIRALQDGFDYRLIPYTQAYYNMVPAESPIPEWKVSFEGSFWGHHSRERAGKEIPLNKQFVWKDETWTIPAIYTCTKGLVIDFCLQVPPERIRAFMDQWNLSADHDGTGFTDEQRMQIDAENPLAVHINPKAALNGTELLSSHGSGLCWNPCFPEGNSLEAWSVMFHYGLDLDRGYVIWRSAFPWKTKRKPQIKTLSVTLIQEPVAIPGARFEASFPGEQIEFIHPTTRKKHILTVQEYEQQELSDQQFSDPDLEFPKHYIMMSYTLSPNLPNRALTISDCTKGDRPRRKQTDPRSPQATGDVCLHITGRADGTTAILFGGGSQDMLHRACSALHFEPVNTIAWRTVFYETLRQDITVNLI